MSEALSTTAQLLSNDSVWESSVNIHNSAEDELNRFGNHSQDHSLKLAISSKDNAAWQTDHFQKGYPYPINTSSISPISVSPSTPSFSVSFSPTSSSGSISPRNLSEASVQSFSSASEQPSSRRSAQTQKTDSYFSNFDVEQGYKPKTTQASSGRKRRIVFEGDDAEERRQKFLERNRVAAYKCRQKKKTWVQELEQRSDSVDKQNEQLRDEVAKLKEESIYLRNILLTHGDCNCESIQTYLRKTSAELTESIADQNYSPNMPVITPQSSFLITPEFQTSLDSTCGLLSAYPPFQELSSGLTPFLNTSMDQSEPIDYFS